MTREAREGGTRITKEAAKIAERSRQGEFWRVTQLGAINSALTTSRRTTMMTPSAETRGAVQQGP